MKIAIISDIHANLPAFEETLKSIEENEVDAIYCLGDLVGYNIWPNAVINEIRKRKIPTIAGNHDVKAVEIHKNEIVGDTTTIAYKMIAKNNIEYLSDLPAHIKLEFTLNNQMLTMLFVHGSPFSNTEYLFENKDEKELLDIFQKTGTDILVCGHTHIPYHRIIESKNQTNKYYHAINAGSVGKPKDGNIKSCYAIITINKKSNCSNKESINVKFIRVKYDIEKVVKTLENSELPSSYAKTLLQAL
ncbi:metallophosphoesterase family protein [Flavobacterium piscis]|uniref:Phosphoesterase n=1 Tax=Flavobacterium piscis TaxID=1114874 RepID=A0ABU1Y7K5_9FLAO|nr:metallophosphoesterase family protein [Flavobacterium piscis]MDR7210224.1 putative phosphoesterase [Flavobacterium piscis]